MRFIYFFLILFLFSCKSTEQTTGHLRVDTIVNKLDVIDSSRMELNCNILDLNFDSLKVKVSTPVLSSEDKKDTKVVEAVMYGGSIKREENCAVVEQTAAVDSTSVTNVAESECTSAEETVAIGKPPNMFFLYLIIICAILLFLYLKFR